MASPFFQLGYRFVDLASRQGHLSPEDLDLTIIVTAIFKASQERTGLRQEAGSGEQTQAHVREPTPASFLGGFELFLQRIRIVLRKSHARQKLVTEKRVWNLLKTARGGVQPTKL